MSAPRKKIATVVIFDLECTGLNRPRVTELCLLSVQREELLTPIGQPRICNKLVLCVNPGKMIEPEASKVSGLYNDALESQPTFDEDTVTSISLFLSRLPSPICLLAHNGNGFDFKVLNSEIKRINKMLSDEIYCADSLDALRELDCLSAAEEKPTDITTTTTTPTGQSIPEVPEQVIDVKLRARQVKRKCDADFEAPTPAKSLRKRLFDSAGNRHSEMNEDPLDLIGHKPVGSSMRMSADVVSKRDTCDVESVKKRLNFDDEDEEEEDEDTEMSISEGKKRLANQNELTPDNISIFHGSQGSLPDVDLLHAVHQLENETSKPVQNSECDTNMHCVSPVSTHRALDCFTPVERTVSVLTHCEGLCTPETPSTSGQSITSVCMSTPQNHLPLTPRRDEGLSLEKNTHPTNLMEETQSPSTGQCLTPMTGLVRSTAAFQLGTPVNNNKNLSQKDTVPNGMTCRSLFRAKTDVAFAECKLKTSSAYSKRLSYKLGEVYKRMFGREPDNLHCAETDCITLMKIVKHRAPTFIQWVDEHAVLLSSID